MTGRNGEEPLFVTEGNIPDGLEGTIVGEWWRSGLTDLFIQITYFERPDGWKMRVGMIRKDNKRVEGQRMFDYDPPRNAEELEHCLMDATRRIRGMARLGPRRSVMPPIPGNMDKAVGECHKTRGAGRG